MSWILLSWALLLPLLLLGTLLPTHLMPQRLPNDKLLHWGGACLLALPLALLAGQPPQLLAGALILLAGSLAVELLQHFVPGRRFCWRDMAANVGGFALGLVPTVLLILS